MFGMMSVIHKPKLEKVDVFLKRMPAFVGRRQKLTALMTSYNGISGMTEGHVSGLLGGRLDITIHVGANEGLMAATGGLGNAQKAQAEVERRTRLDGTLFDLAIVYVGHTMFERSLLFARSLKRHDKALRVAVLTCGCGLEQKRVVLDPLLTSGELLAAAWTSDCGGHDDMRAILDRLEACFVPKAK